MAFSVSVQVVTGLVIALVVQRFVAGYAASRHYRRFARENGCSEPPTLVNKLPGGLERMIAMFKFEGDFMDGWVMPNYYKLGFTHKSFGAFGRQNIDTIDPLNIHTMLNTKFRDFGFGGVREMMFGPLLGHGIATSDGLFWEHSRALMRPQFSREQVTNLHNIDTQVRVFFKALTARSVGLITEVDLMPMFYRLTFDSATEFLFGESVNSQLANLTEMSAKEHQGIRTISVDPRARLIQSENEWNQKFAEAFQYAQDFLLWRLQLQGLFWLGTSSRFREACAICHRFADRFVNKALSTSKHYVHKPQGTEPKKFNLLEALAADTQDPKELRDQILQVLSGGRDTTASLLSWIFCMFAHYPAEFSRLQAEVLAVFGSEADPKDVEITADRLKSVNYLKWFINETLRLFPVVPNNNRVAVRDTTLPHGGGPDGTQPIAIMAGDVVGWTPYGMHRREDLWGPDAAEFKPARWNGRKPGPEFLPFNSGPRTCIGQQFALNEISYVVVCFLQRFDKIELLDPNEKLEKKVSLGLSPTNGVKVRLHRMRGVVE